MSVARIIFCQVGQEGLYFAYRLTYKFLKNILEDEFRFGVFYIET
jgi:hypothetical protein